MNSKGINLISSKNELLEKESRRIKKVRLIAVIFLLVVAGISLTVFTLNFSLPIQAVMKEKEATLKNISSMHEKLVKYVYANERSDNISKIFSQRKNFVSAADEVLVVKPVELSVDKLDVDSATTSLLLTVSGDSLVPVNSFIDNIIAIDDGKHKLQNVSIEGITLDVPTGKYSLSLRMNFL